MVCTANAKSNEMRSRQRQELTSGDDLGFLPELREMARTSRHQVVSTGGVGAFQKNVVVRIARHEWQAGRSDAVCAVLDDLPKLPAETFANVEFRPRQNITIFREYGIRDVQTRGLGEGEQEHRARQTFGLQCSRHQKIGVENQAQRKHSAFFSL